MARRVPVSDTKTAIQYIEEDGGVILTGFTSREDVEQVNADAEPYIRAILEDVRKLDNLLYLPFQKADILLACIKKFTQGDHSMYPSIWTEYYSTRNMAPTTSIPGDPESFPADRILPVSIPRQSGRR